MTKQKRPADKAATRFGQMFRSLPTCGAIALHGGERTEEDLVFTIETEIDLTEEGQDGTDRRNLKPLRNWLKKWAPQSDRNR